MLIRSPRLLVYVYYFFWNSFGYQELLHFRGGSFVEIIILLYAT